MADPFAHRAPPFVEAIPAGTSRVWITGRATTDCETSAAGRAKPMKMRIAVVALLLASPFSVSGASTSTDTLATVADTVPKSRRDTAQAEPIIWLAEDYPLVHARIAELRGTGPRYSIIRSTSSLLWTGDNPDGVRGLAP